MTPEEAKQFCKNVWENHSHQKFTFVNVGLVTDLYEEVAASSWSRMLFAEDADLGNQHGFRGGDTRRFPLDELHRQDTFVRVWWWDFDDGSDAAEIEVCFPYYDDDGGYIGTQEVGIYIGGREKGYLHRRAFITEYFETGYEGHHSEGTYDLEDDDWAFLDTVVTHVRERLAI